MCRTLQGSLCYDVDDALQTEWLKWREVDQNPTI